MKIATIGSPKRLDALQQQYMQQTTAALDGMWLFGFVPVADHYGVFEGEELVGFGHVNAQGYLLQFFLSAVHRHRSSEVFASLFEGSEAPCGKLEGAFVSTAEPQYLSLCLDRFEAFEVNALMYTRDRTPVDSSEGPGGNIPPLTAIDDADRAQAVAFAVDAIGAPQGWLNGYYANLIGRGELFGIWDGGRLIALGENRGRDRFQMDCADLGMVVAKSERGRGIATEILRRFAATNDRRGLRSICSTERQNIAAQKAIERAGFVAHHRILRFRVRDDRRP